VAARIGGCDGYGVLARWRSCSAPPPARGGGSPAGRIHVQFLGGDGVTAKVVASEPAADLSLLQLERVPPGARVARMADSNTVQVGEQVVIVGAP